MCALAGALCAIGGELLGDPCLNVALAVEHPTADRFRGFSSKTSRSMSLVWRRMICVPGFHPHELRHTAASLAIASGADVKIVQQMLGHKSATMTLDLYGHLFPDRLDLVADAMDADRVKALSDRHQTGTKQEPAAVVDLGTRR